MRLLRYKNMEVQAKATRFLIKVMHNFHSIGKGYSESEPKKNLSLSLRILTGYVSDKTITVGKRWFDAAIPFISNLSKVGNKQMYQILAPV